MKSRTAVASLCLALVVGFAAEAAAQKAKAAPKGPDTKVIAAQLVKQVANVKEGDIVFIEGDVRDLDLLEDLAVETRKQGAFPLSLVGREKTTKRFWDEVPEKLDSQAPALALKLWQIPTVHIAIEGEELPGLLKHVPPARLAARGKAGEPVSKLMVKRGLRCVRLGNGLYPTAATAKLYGLTKDQLAKIFWDGVAVEPAKLQAAAERVRAVLAKGQTLQVTHPNGTDLKVRILARPVGVSDGALTDAKVKKGGTAAWTWLPAGEVYVTPVPGTAEGKLVVERFPWNDGEVQGLTVTFKAGKVSSMTAKPSATYDRFKAQYDAAAPRKDELSAVDVGVNPAVKIPKGSKLLTWVAEGTVTVVIGNNAWAGGDNTISFVSPWWLNGATLLVDGKPLVEKGVLKVPAAP
jgi:aminopeptidase